MSSKILNCEECKYEDSCPVQWHEHSAACLTIQKEKDIDEYEEQVNWNYMRIILDKILKL